MHPKYRTPYRSILFLLPIALAFAFIADLNQAITFSILSGVLQYTFMSINIMMFRKKWPLGTIRRGYTHPFHPIPAIVLFLCVVTFFAIFLGYGSQLIAMVVLLPDLAVVPFLPLQVRAPRRPVHHAVAEAAGLLKQQPAQVWPVRNNGPYRFMADMWSTVFGSLAAAGFGSHLLSKFIKARRAHQDAPERLFGAARAMFFDELYLEATGSIRISAACGTLSRL